MKKSFLSLNTIILLASLAYLSGIARLILEVRFVPEIMNAMPANQPAQVALVMVIFILIFSGWLWALVSASRNRRRGLISLLVFSLLLAFGWGAGLGWPYYVGVGIGAGLIGWEHQLVRPGDLSRLNAAFFTANGIVSIVVFLGALVDRIV